MPYNSAADSFHTKKLCSKHWKARCWLPISVNFSLGATAEALRANIDWNSTISLQRGPVDPKFQVEGVAPTNHSSSHKTRLNGLSCGIKIWTYLSFILSQMTRLTGRRTDRQTDGRTDRILIARRVCIPCSSVKTRTRPGVKCTYAHKMYRIKDRL